MHYSYHSIMATALGIQPPILDFSGWDDPHRPKAMLFPVVMNGCEIWTIKNVAHRGVMLLNCGVGEDS